MTSILIISGGILWTLIFIAYVLCGIGSELDRISEALEAIGKEHVLSDFKDPNIIMMLEQALESAKEVQDA